MKTNKTVDTSTTETTLNVTRTHTPEFKAQLVKECEAPNVNVSALARAHNINPLLLYRWVKQLGTKANAKRTYTRKTTTPNTRNTALQLAGPTTMTTTTPEEITTLKERLETLIGQNIQLRNEINSVHAFYGRKLYSIENRNSA